MEIYLTSKDFIHQVENKTVTGKFLINSSDESIQDMDFKGVLFKDAEIHGGEFVSGSFINCTFDNVIFNKSSLVGVNFNRCNFKKCTFNKTQHDFGMDNCVIDRFQLTTFFHFPNVKAELGEEE